MKKTLLLAIFLSALAPLGIPSEAGAQEVVGTAVLGGKKVHLLGDGTWEYSKSDGPQKCVAIHKNIDFCGSVFDWKPVGARFDFSHLFQHTNRLHAGLIIEEIGFQDGNNIEFMRGNAIDTLADASGVLPEQIPVLLVEESEIGKFSGETIVYGARIDGLNIVYANNIFIEDNLTMQVVVWNIASEYTDEHREWNSDFLANLRLSFEDQTQ
ncbi:hypothetical protein Q5Y75_02990 [Ruegeria sp. 2205SS24-7]|uniref:hypothetical protein n=1 Tax=Ruegeria discodermiae TaxID=3064389 RepID=UPI00274216F1|nr:hypothetical protein [Ruegeria sp. 2205SS24-7]MDP5216171.1 hypothetical protein [Ruegeria sp. 2205SS24-7]